MAAHCVVRSSSYAVRWCYLFNGSVRRLGWPKEVRNDNLRPESVHVRPAVEPFIEIRERYVDSALLAMVCCDELALGSDKKSHEPIRHFATGLENLVH